ncbi:MAG: 4-hydroxy-2-oxoheptanedioate aldolase [Candidatus Promineifilaceae bacterium]|jgi:4-hydroxy-2-oxoheptanedioate aldolase
MKAAKLLREKVDRGDVVTGLLAMNHVWLELIEISKNAGMDYLIIDMEHGSPNVDTVVEACALGRMIDFPVLIRPVDHEMSTIRKAIDMGACGFLLPTVQSASDLDKIRDAIWMPPRGQRRPGGRGNAWTDAITLAGWQRNVEDHFIVMPQIETQTGLDNVAEIAAHEITTYMAHGPYDLSCDLGVAGEMAGPEVSAANKQIQAAAHAVGKKMWVIGDGAALRQQGFTFICNGAPMGILQAGMAKMVADTQAAGGNGE